MEEFICGLGVCEYHGCRVSCKVLEMLQDNLYALESWICVVC